MKPTALVLAALLSLGLTACSGDDEPGTTKTPATTPTLPVAVGTVQGRLVLEGGVVAEDQTIAGKLLIKGPGGATVTADIKDDGRFAIQLAPGEYRITASSPTYLDSRGTCTTNPQVTELVADKTVETDVICRTD